VPRTEPPPSGPPWDSPIGSAALAFVDLEMTGLDVTKDRVVEICIERVVGGALVDALTTLVDPGDERVGGAAHVHGIDAAALEGAPKFGSLAADVARLLDGAILVAHAASWDIDFLSAEMKRAGASLAVPHYLDTLTLARRAFSFQRYALDALCTSLGIERGVAHRAASDVLALRAVFDKCVSTLAPVSARDLWEVRVGERRARAVIVDACESAAKHGLTVVVTYRPSRKPPQTFPFTVLEVRSDLDPPHVVGYQLPGRGRRELRTDRILRVDPAPARVP
jgi:DNA polymerase-3 subunit epsilon